MAHFFMGCIVTVWSAVGMLGGLFFLAAALMALGNKKNRMDWKIDIIIAIANSPTIIIYSKFPFASTAQKLFICSSVINSF